MNDNCWLNYGYACEVTSDVNKAISITAKAECLQDQDKPPPV